MKKSFIQEFLWSRGSKIFFIFLSLGIAVHSHIGQAIGQVKTQDSIEKENKIKLKEFKKAQAAKFLQWKHQEKDARHHFFQDHQKGSERRAYIQDFLKRRKDLQTQLSKELNKYKQELSLKISSDQLEQEKI